MAKKKPDVWIKLSHSEADAAGKHLYHLFMESQKWGFLILSEREKALVQRVISKFAQALSKAEQKES